MVERFLLPPLIQVGLCRERELEELHLVRAGRYRGGVVARRVRLGVRDLAEGTARYRWIDDLHVNPRQGMTFTVVHVTANQEPRRQMRIDA